MNIFLIYSNEDDYESQNIVIGYATTEDEAAAAVESLKKDYLKARDFYENVVGPADRKFDVENPAPQCPPLTQHPIWKSGIGASEITEKMRDERKSIKEKNEQVIAKHSSAYKDWQIKKIENIKPIIDPSINEPWFQKWFEIGDRFIMCNAGGLVKGHEYIYESCEKI